MKESEISRIFRLLGRRWVVVAIVCIVGFGLLPVAATHIASYKGTAGLLVVSEAVKDTTLSDPDLPSIITSTEVMARVIRRLNLDTDPIALSKKVKTKLPAKSSILEISYQDTDSVRAAAVTNAIADEASSYFHEIATRGYNDVIAALNVQIKNSKSEIADANKRLQEASAQNAFASSDNALDDLTTQINELREQRGEINASLAADRASSAALGQQLRDIAPIVRGEILQKDPVVQQIQSGLAKDVAVLNSERASFRESFPGLAALKSRVANEGSQLAPIETTAVTKGVGLSPSYTQTVLDSERASGLVEADAARLQATDAQLDADQLHLQQVAQAGAIVATLRAERDTALQQYEALSQRLSAAQGDAAQAASLGTLVVVSRALPGPSSMGLWLTALGLVVLFLAIIADYAVDAIDRRFWGTPDIESVYGRPVLLRVGSR